MQYSILKNFFLFQSTKPKNVPLPKKKRETETKLGYLPLSLKYYVYDTRLSISYFYFKKDFVLISFVRESFACRKKKRTEIYSHTINRNKITLLSIENRV